LSGGEPGSRPPAAVLQGGNPFAGQPASIAEGQRLYKQSGCVNCHGAQGEGGMGPDLSDEEWLHGGGDPEVFRSIARGRPDGMPAWGTKLKEDQIWMIVAYIRSLK
jgi:cytochrome c oxidase cbb3-type subunit 3